MRFKHEIAILISLVLMMSGVVGLQFAEKINTNGDGALYSKTDIDEGGDMVQVAGEIEYIRTVDMSEDQLGLSSNLALKNGKSNSYSDYGSFKVNGTSKSNWKPYMLGYDVSRYSIGTSGDLSHRLTVYGTTDITSNSTILYKDMHVGTNYNIKATGALNEKLDDFRYGERNTVAETSISGRDFTVLSGMTEVVPVGTEFNILSDMINQTEMKGEASVQEKPTPLKRLSDAFAENATNVTQESPQEGMNASKNIVVSENIAVSEADNFNNLIDRVLPTVEDSSDSNDRAMPVVEDSPDSMLGIQSANNLCNLTANKTEINETRMDWLGSDEAGSGEAGSDEQTDEIVVVVSETDANITGVAPKVLPNFIESPECGPGKICLNYTHLFAIRRPGINQPLVPTTTGGAYITYRRPVEALIGL